MHTTTIAALDENGGVTKHFYHYTRTARIAGRTVRASIRRDFYLEQSHAVAEILADTMTWTALASDAPCNWFHDTPSPHPTLYAAAELGVIADRLLDRAADILVPPDTAPQLDTTDLLHTLFASIYGYGREVRLDPDDMRWADEHGHPFLLVRHEDGAVTLTKQHQPGCAFVLGTGDRDDDCACTDWTPPPASSTASDDRKP